MLRRNRIQVILNIVLISALLSGMFSAIPVQAVRAATLTVTSTNDSGAGSLRQAIADAVSGDTITFDASLAGQIITLASDLIIDTNLTIDGSGLSPQITISGGDIAHLEIDSTISPVVTISDLTISNGYTGDDGGAIFSGSEGILTVINSTLRNNHALGAGGAIFAFRLILQNTAIYNNQAGGGGAIFLIGNGNATISNSTIVQNEASDSGGAIFMQGNGFVDIFNSTVAGNSAANGKEVWLSGNIFMVLYNTIFACAPPDNDNCYVMFGTSFIGNNHSIVDVGTLADFGLAELADNGGPTKTFALLPGSPLIDAGDDATCLSTDQRGIARPQGAHCDIGAYEYYDGTISAGETVRVSIDSSGLQGNGFSYAPSISADGHYIAFYSDAPNLVSGDTNATNDVFVHDTQTDTTMRVSVESSGAQGIDHSWAPSISADGRYIVFSSLATNLVSGDTNSASDVFVHDMQSGMTTRVSVDSNGSQANGTSYGFVSANGRYIVFGSDATNLISNDTNGMTDVFVHDMQTGMTTRVSVDSNDGQANNDSGESSISADGRYVAFFSFATNLISGDSNGTSDIFVHDMQTGMTTLVSQDSNGEQANGASSSPAISENGHYIAFSSLATNLVSGDTNGIDDVFVHDVQTSMTTRVSLDSNGAQANDVSRYPSISADGRYVAFETYAANLVSGDTNAVIDAFVHDVQTGTTRRVSVSSSNAEGNDSSGEVAISADGRFTAFTSYATNLVSGDTNTVSDIFVHRQNIIPPPPPAIHYVKWNAVGLNNGTSWTDAYTDLQSALFAASSGDEIWVATGTYKPIVGTDRAISFMLKNGVAIYGGFAGTETLVTQRDPATNVTILSGDIGASGNNSDNSYHVVIGSGTNNSAILDGFTITAGNADGSSHPHDKGGGMYTNKGHPSLTNVIFGSNSATFGGGMYNDGEFAYPDGSNPILTNVSFTGNSAIEGGGMENMNHSNPTLTNVTFSNNTAIRSGGGMINFNQSSPTLTNITFSENAASAGGGMMMSSSNPSLTNVTFSANSAIDWGGGIYNDNGSKPNLTNVTFNGNEAGEGGGMYNAYGSEPSITNSILYGNPGGEIFDVSGTRVVTHSIVQGGYPGTGNLDANPLLGPLADNGGFTQTMALTAGSPAIDAGLDASCPSTDQRGVTRPQGSHCDIGAFEFEPSFADVDVNIAGNTEGDEIIIPFQSGQRHGFAVDNGPAQVVSTNSVDIITALRVIWQEPGYRASYSEMMGLPKEQLSTEYWFPWYNNLDKASMDQGFRIANVDSTTHTIRVFLGSTQVGNDIILAGGGSIRVGYEVNNGPIRIACMDCINPDEKIIAALRVIWKEPGVRFSYSEMMGLPKEQLSSEYWFPWYNNAVPSSMDQGFRIANVSTTESNSVEVWVGTTKLDTITLGAGASTRVGYSVDNGPIKILCTTCTNTGDDKIIAALRVIWKEPGFRASYSEMMGLPKEQLSDEYWFPWYNNHDTASMDQGFRIANVDASQHTIRIYVGTTQVGNDIILAGGGSIRVGYDVNSGPIHIVCVDCSNQDDKIIVALRVIWQEPGVRTSYSEMMGLPKEQLSTEYWFPWYNNAAINSMDQGFRIAVP